MKLAAKKNPVQHDGGALKRQTKLTASAPIKSVLKKVDVEDVANNVRDGAKDAAGSGHTKNVYFNSHVETALYN